MGNRSKVKNTLQEPVRDRWEMLATWVLAFCSSLVPLFVVLHRVDLDKPTSLAYSGASAYIDIFNYWKSTSLTICLVLLLLFWLAQIFQRKNYSLKAMFLPLALYALLAVVSAFASKYSWIAFNGYPDRLEGLKAILCYVMLAFTAATVLKTESSRAFVLMATMMSSVVLGLLGATQYLGADFFKTAVGRRILVPSSYSQYLDKLDFNFGANVMYTTVYNPNYLGSYSALLLPIAIMIFLAWKSEAIWKRILGVLFVAATFILWLGGMSRAGLLGGAIGIVLLFILAFKPIIQNWKASLILVATCLVLFVTMNTLSEGAVFRELRNTMPSSIASLFPENITPPATAESSAPAAPAATTADAPVIPPKPLVKSTTLKDNSFRYETETETLVVKFNADTFELLDGAGNPLNYTMTATPAADGSGNTVNDIIFTNPAYAGYSMRTVNSGILLKWYDISIPLVVVNGKLTVNTKEGVYVTELDNPPTFGFKGHELFANSRGYIWSRSIPLMKDTLIIGRGPDTLAAYFPQNDLVGKINYLFSYNRILDKPHNWYIQMGVNTGVLSLLAVLVFLGWYIIRGFSVRNEPELADGRLIHIGILCGVVGYCIAAVFNDSNVSVSPVFWVILGVGLSYVVNVKKKGKTVPTPV